MNSLTQLISIQAIAPLIAVILVGAIVLHAYWKYKKQNKPCLLPNTCQLIHKEIYLINQELEETNDTERIQILTKRLLNLEEHLVSLHDYDLSNYPEFNWKVALVLILISGAGFGAIAGIFILIF